MLTRDPGFFSRKLGPGSAAHRCALRRVPGRERELTRALAA